MKKILVIDKCEECNRSNCSLRKPCGSIPEECPLKTYTENFRSYLQEHQFRTYAKNFSNET